MSSVETFRLASGRVAHLVTPKSPFRHPYRALVFGQGQGGPSAEEQVEMLGLALAAARQLSQAQFGDPERYMLIQNGLGARRARDFHCHVIVVSGRLKKTGVYLWLFLKNVLHPFWLIARPLRRRLARPHLDQR